MREIPMMHHQTLGGPGPTELELELADIEALQLRIIECIPMYPTCIVSISCVSHQDTPQDTSRYNRIRIR